METSILKPEKDSLVATALQDTEISPPKLQGYEFYHKGLGSPKYAMAPMVDQSELAWRILCRRYNTSLCYTPMVNASIFVRDPVYQKEVFTTIPEDRPLIVQLAGHDPEVMLKAGLMLEDHCDAVDINLGCPQHIAKRGCYGAYLMDHWETVQKIVETLHARLKIPVTCKIRVFEDQEKTLSFAKMLENAGCQLLTVHGRLRVQKKQLTGFADWNIIKRVRESLSIPMLANGNVLYKEDADRLIAYTGVDGVMSGEGILHDPGIFSGIHRPLWKYAEEYLDICEKHTPANNYIRGHFFRLYKRVLHLVPFHGLRDKLTKCHSVSEYREFQAAMKEQLLSFYLLSLPEDRRQNPTLDELVVPVTIRKTEKTLLSHLKLLPIIYAHAYARPLDLEPRAAQEPGTCSTEPVHESSKLPLIENPIDLVNVSTAIAGSAEREIVLKQRQERKEKRQLVAGSRALKMCQQCYRNNFGANCEHRLCKRCCPRVGCSQHVAFVSNSKKQKLVDTKNQPEPTNGLIHSGIASVG